MNSKRTSASSETSGTFNSSIRSAASAANKFVNGGGQRLSWAELKSIETKRRAVLKRNEVPFYRKLLFYNGTCLEDLLTDPLLWLTMAIYIGVRVALHHGRGQDDVVDMKEVNIGVIGAFLSFFLVFYVVYNNHRFDKLYGESMTCKASIFDIATLVGPALPRANALRLVRYMNAAHMAGYVGLSSTYTYNNFFEVLNKTEKVLTNQECERMKEIDMDKNGGSCYRELIAWCEMEVEDALASGAMNDTLAFTVRSLILQLQDSMAVLYDFDDQRVPFFYLHFICLLSILYLPLFAISEAFEAGTGEDMHWTTDVVGGVIVFLQSVFVIGLRLLGQKMSDPYGSDVEDLSVIFYVSFTWQMSNRILDAPAPAPLNAGEEEAIVQSRESIGAAWDDTSGKC